MFYALIFYHPIIVVAMRGTAAGTVPASQTLIRIRLPCGGTHLGFPPWVGGES